MVEVFIPFGAEQAGCRVIRAGLIRADLRDVRGSDIICRSGGVVVQVCGHRLRVVPVLTRYHGLLLASAAFAGTALITGGRDPGHRNVTTPLLRSLAGGTGLPRLDTSRLRATSGRRLRPARVRPVCFKGATGRPLVRP